jgi:hypothetical protein
MESIKGILNFKGRDIPIRISAGQVVVRFIDHTESEEVQTVVNDDVLCVEFFPDEPHTIPEGGNG